MAWPKGRKAHNAIDDGLTRKQRWYKNHPEAKAERIRSQAERNLALIRAARTGPCLDCGRDDLPPEAMDLDHVPERGAKSFGLGLSGANRRRGRANLEAEIAKCDRVCPTCHRLRTIARGWHKE